MRTIFTVLVYGLLTLPDLKAQLIKSEDDSLAYSLGVLVAGNLKNEGYGDLNTDIFMAGLKAVMNSEETLIPQAQCEQNVRVGMSRRKMKQHEGTKKAGEDFLAQNKLRKEVTTLPSGVQYEILKAGDGPKPKSTDKVRVHYHGTLVDGTIFDSSVDRNEPISFGLNQVIKGWTEAVQLMPVGSKWKVFIPYGMAYGERGSAPIIQPFAALIFEIELLGIE